jgi:arsenate reductase
VPLGGFPDEPVAEIAPAPTTMLTPEFPAEVSILIRWGCGDQCPVMPGVTRDDWPVEDP